MSMFPHAFILTYKHVYIHINAHHMRTCSHAGNHTHEYTQ